MKFEQNIDPKEAMEIGYSWIIKKFDELGKPYHFYRVKNPDNPKFSEIGEIKWIRHWENSWKDLVSLYAERNIIHVFFSSANGGHGWSENVNTWLYPEIWYANFEY